MTRRSLRNRRERFPETYTAPARAPAPGALPPGFRVVEVTPAMRARMQEGLVELTRVLLGLEYTRRLFVVLYRDKPVFSLIEAEDALRTLREFMQAAVATGAAVSDFTLVVREISAHLEGDQTHPAVPVAEEGTTR